MSIELVVIGLGNHTKSKIIPALQSLSIPIRAIISEIDLTRYEDIEVFNSISSIRDSDTITHFIISTTPSKQIKYIKAALLMNIKAFVEKPAFTSEEDLLSVHSFLKDRLFLTEGMMYRFCESYKYFYANFSKIKDSNYELSINFILPNKSNIINDTFRSKVDIKNSIVYDIGPYVFDLMWALQILNFQIYIIKIEKFTNNIFKRLRFLLVSDENSSININVNIGYDNCYKNEINLVSNNHNLTLYPFFWGRSGEINVRETRGRNIISKKIETKNALVEILLGWLNNSKDKNYLDLQNLKRYKFVTYQLVNLEREINKNVK